MADRNTNRDRNNWDWDYYYEYRYTPYRGNDYYGDFYDRDAYSPYYGRDYYGRNYNNYNRNYNGPYYRNRDYDRDFDYTYGTSYPYGYGNTNYGRYTGYGPSGYTRSDERIKDDINDRLTWDGRIDATDINVDVNDGIVSLTGSVDSRQDKRTAEDIVDDIPGVWDVNNQLRVRNRGYYRGQQGSRGQFHEGMDVVGSDGSHVGQVKEVRSSDFLVDRSMARDIYIPFSACSVSGDQVHLNVKADQVDDQGWEMPEMVGTESQRSQKRR